MSEAYTHVPETRFGRLKRLLSEFANDHVRLVLLGPALLSLVVIFIYPVAYLVWSSMQRTLAFGVGSEFAPAANYEAMASDPTFWNAAEKTLFYSFGSFAVTMLTGLVIALALNKVACGRPY
jgi:multiple sugar transport system permease protein